MFAVLLLGFITLNIKQKIESLQDCRGFIIVSDSLAICLQLSPQGVYAAKGKMCYYD